MDAFRAAISRDPVLDSGGVYQVDQADQRVTPRGKGKGRKRGNRAGKKVDRRLQSPPIPAHASIAYCTQELRAVVGYAAVLEARIASLTLARAQDAQPPEHSSQLQ
jgi:hypothetical protein